MPSQGMPKEDSIVGAVIEIVKKHPSAASALDWGPYLQPTNLWNYFDCNLSINSMGIWTQAIRKANCRVIYANKNKEQVEP